eukprot:m.193079 g.193079  ORF g.193079 m.193079 type:complete len:382 (+) comp53677_c0_seq2:117-1262(+)
MALRRLRVIEFAGLAPVPMAGMILADFGADVIRLDRVSQTAPDTLHRGKRSIALNLKSPKGIKIAHHLCNQADVVLDPYRPGVLERLGLGPAAFQVSNPKLIYARISGFGQSGPLKLAAGHDINYIAQSGVLDRLRKPQGLPTPPVNLIADFAGGAFSSVIGILLALYQRTTTGRGQIVDASMAEGSGYLASFLFTSMKFKDFFWPGEPGTNMLDGGAPFYRTYETKDKKFVAVGAIEPPFYSALLTGLGLREEQMPGQSSDWEATSRKFEEIFKSKTRDEWVAIFDGTDACVSAVLSQEEAFHHPHNKERVAFVQDHRGNIEPAPAPRLSEHPSAVAGTQPLSIGQHTAEVLREFGFSPAEVDSFIQEGIALTAHAESKL